MIKVTGFTPIWKRPLLTALYMRHMEYHVRAARKSGIDLTIIVVGSEGDVSRQYVKGLSGFRYVECENRPLGGKFNAGVAAARDTNPDYFTVFGSDCFFLPTLWHDVANALHDAPEYVGVRDLYMWNPDTGDAMYWPGYEGRREGVPIGSGRFVRRDVMDRLGWILYDGTLSKNLDHSADKVLPDPILISSKDHLLTSVKSATSLTPMPLDAGNMRVDEAPFIAMMAQVEVSTGGTTVGDIEDLLITGGVISDKRVLSRDINIDSVAGPHVAGSHAMAYSDGPFEGRFRGSLLIAKEGTDVDAAPSTAIIFVASPKLAYALVVRELFPHLWTTTWPTMPRTFPDVSAHSSCVIADNVVVGRGCTIGPNTVIANATLGDGVHIGANCTIGLDGFGIATRENGETVQVPHIGNVVIGDHVRIGSNTCIDRATIGSTVLHRYSCVDNLVHVAHNCIIHEGAQVVAGTVLGGSSVIGKGAFVGINASVRNKLLIGDSATIGMGAVVVKNVEEGKTVKGNPAK